MKLYVKEYERAGFAEVKTWLEPYPVRPPDPISFVSVVCLGPHLERLPEQLHDSYARAVLRAQRDRTRLRPAQYRREGPRLTRPNLRTCAHLPPCARLSIDFQSPPG